MGGPIGVAENDGGIPARRVIGRNQKAPEGGPDAQYFEEVAGDHFRRGAHGFIAGGESSREADARHQTVENTVLVAERLVHRVREDAEVVVTAAGTEVVIVGFKQDQRTGVLDWQRTHDHLIQEREDGGVRADSERQGQDGKEGEPGRAPEGPQGKSKIVPHSGPSVCKSTLMVKTNSRVLNELW